MFEIVKTLHQALGTESTFVFVLVVALAFGGTFSVGGGVAAYLVDRVYKNSVINDFSTPLVVEADINRARQLTIEVGKAPISEVKVYVTSYELKKIPFEVHHKIEIDKYSHISAPLWKQEAVSNSAIFDLSASAFLKFSGFPDSADELASSMRKYYCLRITFRDPRSHQRYVIYRVIGSVKNSPSFFENLNDTAIAGPGGPFFLMEVPKVILAHERSLFSEASTKEFESQ